MKRAGIIATLVGAGLAANAGIFLMLKGSAVERDAMWSLMEAAKIPARPDVAPTFPQELRAKDGERVSISGVAFVMPDGVQDGNVRWCVLMPPARYGCCGVSCDPRPEMTIYVDCSKAPWPVPEGPQVMATVQGRLRLEKGSESWCLYTLEDAAVRTVAP